MILTVTPNPAWDISYRVERLSSGLAHEVREVRQRPGGKGVNVASVLTCMGQRAAVLVPLGGPMADAFADGLNELGLTASVVSGESSTRRTVTVHDDTGATLLSEPGCPQPERVWEELLARIEANQDGATVLTVSGSLPPQAPADLLARMVSAGHAAGMKVVLDCRGPALWNALAQAPELVRMNQSEACLTTGERDQHQAALALMDAGAQAVAISAGRAGVLLVANAACCPRGLGENERRISLRAWLLWPLTGNANGAGDALTAALASALADEQADPGVCAARLRQNAAPAAAPATAPRAPIFASASVEDRALAVAAHPARPLAVSAGQAGLVPQQGGAAAVREQASLEAVQRWARALRAGVAWSAAAVLQPVAGVVSPAHADALRSDVVIEVLG